MKKSLVAILAAVAVFGFTSMVMAATTIGSGTIGVDATVSSYADVETVQTATLATFNGHANDVRTTTDTGNAQFTIETNEQDVDVTVNGSKLDADNSTDTIATEYEVWKGAVVSGVKLTNTGDVAADSDSDGYVIEDNSLTDATTTQDQSEGIVSYNVRVGGKLSTVSTQAADTYSATITVTVSM
jgi:hypothetical protein